MGRRPEDAYDNALGLREVETHIADTFEEEFPIVTGQPVKILSVGESPDRVMLVDGIETGVELTSIKAGSACEIISEVLRLAGQKNDRYERHAKFDIRPIILLGHLDWPSKEVEGPALYDVQKELAELIVPDDFEGFRFSEIWLMDVGLKYTSRQDPQRPADFFCFAPTEKSRFWARERKRR
ncbi:MAG: hypothetical protein ACREBW_03560, partial [Candidatus Micrarchaeaceae archaeon]